jgi:hypothetical protein
MYWRSWIARYFFLLLLFLFLSFYFCFCFLQRVDLHDWITLRDIVMIITSG